MVYWQRLAGYEGGNEKGFKLFDSQVGLIYGDSITLNRAERILTGRKAKGFASGNGAFGAGS